MGLFNKLKEPVFLKESSDAEKQLEKLLELEPLLNPEGQVKIRQDIKYLEYGIAGEKNIAFELKNSHMPMYILHDIYLECGELSAQIDYLVFTRKICFVIECKNLYGDIEINNAGDFIRTIEAGGKRKKEGIYSPITQNQRHLELMKKVKMDRKNNILTKYMLERCFEDFNKSVVVLANPKTVLNAKYAKKEVKDKVIRTDQLISYIKEAYKQSKAVEESDEGLLTWANSYLELHKENERDYTGKFNSYKVEEKNSIDSYRAEEKSSVDSYRVEAKNSNDSYRAEEKSSIDSYRAEEKSSVDSYKVEEKNSQLSESEIAIAEEVVPSNTESMEESKIFLELKAYRLAKSREEKIKPYFIYNDNQLRDLISKMPRRKEDLMSVAGFGEVKVNKYGGDILKIMEKY